ncbi:uncharacterized protein METZ01_LOCUS291986, partial [marine metagenome]
PPARWPPNTTACTNSWPSATMTHH